ncbi:MAG TPA: dTDP-4-dehydrorhamnose 3,5-epimerase [Vicinamibacterales bacterium]|nr:dTDP-4-dehydrorhamnose 3,5-epimerase [Vicinamibacterales bacterium]
MRFTPTRVSGAFIVESEPHADERGFFLVLWAQSEFRRQGLATEFAQSSVAYNRARGTLRGMHYQTPPHQEAKLVRCAAGAILDVAIDLRRDSPSFKTWVSVELSAENRRMLYVPEGCAHGYLTLTDETEIFYHASAEYAPQFGGGVRWNDPAFAVEWPFAPVVINARDRDYPDFR